LLITVGRYLNPIEAHIVKGRLEAEGVLAYVQHEHHIWAKWTIAVALGHVKVQVRAEDVEACCAIIEKLRAGEYALADEEVVDISCCPKCGCVKKDRVNWSWKLALWAIVFFSLVLPSSVCRVVCVECGHRWTQKELRAYPLWMSALAIFLIATGFGLFERTFFYICKSNQLSDMCM
jgi:hypothetical protein